MSREEEKATHERAIFAQFAATAGLPVRADSITSERPPRPDVLCEIEGRGSVAFELVQLVDQSWARGINLMFEIRKRARDYFRGLDGRQGEEFRAKFHDAQISLVFANGAPLRAREAVLPALLVDLMAHKGEGNCPDIKRSRRVAGVVGRVAINRGRFVGPVIDATHESMVHDPTEERLRDKLGRSDYDRTHQMELLAYTDGIDLLLPCDVWLPKFEGIIRELVDDSAFDRVWVYHASSDPAARTIKLSVP